LTTATKLPGHETCDYSPFDTAGINMAIEAIDGWLAKVTAMMPQAAQEVAHVQESAGMFSAAAVSARGLFEALSNDVKAAEATRACLMCEIMNRAYADDEKWNRDNPGFSDPLLRLL